MQKMLIAIQLSNAAEMAVALQNIVELQHEKFEIDTKLIVNNKWLDANTTTQISQKNISTILLEDNFESGKTHKIIFEYSKAKNYDFVVVANLIQYNYLKNNYSNYIAIFSTMYCIVLLNVLSLPHHSN